MKPALEAALTRDAAPGFVRQVVFLTDGAVGNEGELIQLIRERLVRPPPVHDRHRLRAELVLPHQGGAIRPRDVHVHRRRARSRREDGRALHQARKPRADRHRHRVAGQDRGLAARAGRPLRGRADRRRRADRCARRRRDDHRTPRRRAVERERAAVGQRERAGHRRAVGAREDRGADRCAKGRRAGSRRAQGA